MANRYWVGGTANWDATAGSKWATTSGGGGGSAVPTTSDDVFFDGASGANTVTITVGASMKSLDCTGFTGTLVHNASVTLQVAGPSSGTAVFKLVAGMGFTVGNASTSIIHMGTGNDVTFNVTSGGKTMGSILMDSNVGTGTSCVLQDAMVLSGSFTLTGGKNTLNANNFNFTCQDFQSNVTTTRTITMGSGTWEITGSAAGTVWNINSTSLTLNANTSTLKFTDTGAAITVAFGGLTYNNVWFARGASTGGITISGTNTFAEFKDTGTAAHTITFPNVTTTVTSWVVSGSAGNVITLQRTGGSGTWTVSDSSGTNTSDYVSISNSTATGGATWNTTNSTNGGGNTGWYFPTNYSLTVDYGSFALNGQDVTLTSTRSVVLDYGSFSLNGQDAALSIGKGFQADFGSFLLNGQSVNLNSTRHVDVDNGSFSLNGQDVSFVVLRNYTLSAVVGSFALNGQIVRFLYNGATDYFALQTKHTSTWTNQTKD